MIRRAFPLGTIGLVLATVLAYVAEVEAGGMSVCRALGFTPAHPSLSAALLSMWLHDPDHLAHIVGNVVALAVLGVVVEEELGRWPLVAVFVAAGLGGALMHVIVEPASGVPLVGMSGSLCGLMAVGAVVRPPLLLGFVVSFIAMNVVELFVSTSLIGPGVSVGAHIGGFCVGAAVMGAGRVRGVRWASG
jgi:membrane associated rhomboid family serine protease